MTRDLGRHVYGVAAIVFGLLTLVWRNGSSWPQLQALGNGAVHEVAVYLIAAFALAGGILIQSRRFARTGSILLGALYSVFALYYIPRIFGAPLVYDRWGNFFEGLSYCPGALIVYASVAPRTSPGTVRLAAIARIVFGVCVASFGLEQAFYLQATAGFVPKWVPLGAMFWSVATTIAFGLAAISIVSGLRALLATRLLTVMLLLFGVIVWIPALVADPHSHVNWSETTETFAITAVAWILADYLGRTE